MAKRQGAVPLGKTHNLLKDRELPYLKDDEHRDRRYLFFVVRNGGKSRRWVFRYTFDKKQKKIEIGTYPKVTLASAREAWGKHNKWLALPVPMDPKDMLAKEASKAKDENLRVAYFVDKLRKQKRAKRSSKRTYVRYWDKIEKTIGDRRAIDVTRFDRNV